MHESLQRAARWPRARPGARAVVGGFLVVTAIIGVVAVDAAARGAPRSRPTEVEVSFTVDTGRAPSSRVHSGDVVHVLLTTGAGPQAVTSIVVRQARVLERPQQHGASTRYIVGVPTEAAAQALLTAAAAGTVSIVRTAATSRLAPTVGS